MSIVMTVGSLAMDPSTKMPFVVLRDAEQKHALPIWIGVFEASAIATELEGVRLARPMTHDLICDLLKTLGGQLLRVEIVDLRENTYIAALTVRKASGEEVVQDARPSDAIALALRTKATILVHESVLEKSRKPRKTETAATSVELLRNLPSEAFGKYKM
jgi:uncharacterized protein